MDMTLQQYADKSGKRYETVWKYFKRTYPDTKWTKDTDIPPDIAAGLSVKKGRTKAAAKPEPQPDKQPAKKTETQPDKKVDWAQVQTVVFTCIAISIVIGHAALIWYDCAVLWSAPGQFIGAMAFLAVCGAVMLSLNPTLNRTSGFAVWVVFLIDASAWWVHFPTFKASAAHVGDIQTGAISAFACIISFAALYMLRDSKLD